MKVEQKVNTKIEEPIAKTVVIYVVAKCPCCGAVFTDYINKDLLVHDQFIECPICDRAIVPGGEDEGEDFE